MHWRTCWGWGWGAGGAAGHVGPQRGRWADGRKTGKTKARWGRLGTDRSPGCARVRSRGASEDSHPLPKPAGRTGARRPPPYWGSSGGAWGGGLFPTLQKTRMRAGIHLSHAGKSERRCASRPATPRTAAGEPSPMQQPWTLSPPPGAPPRGRRGDGARARAQGPARSCRGVRWEAPPASPSWLWVKDAVTQVMASVRPRNVLSCSMIFN